MGLRLCRLVTSMSDSNFGLKVTRRQTRGVLSVQEALAVVTN